MSRPEPRPSISLVICTLDESDAIGPVLREACAALAKLPYEILVVDDSADDRTAAVVLAHAATEPAIRLVRRDGARGLASAAIAGWDAARGEVLAIMDGDGQHDPALLPRLLKALTRDGADLAVASRYLDEGPSGLKPVRHAMSRLATLATRVAIGARATDPMSGFFMLTRGWYEAVRPRLSGVGFKILADLLASGARAPRMVELPTGLRARAGGVSKLDGRVIVELAALLVEKRTGGMIPSRFTLFASVGGFGLLAHLAVLTGLGSAGAPFWAAQAGAILVAMTSNFFLNNALTFRDLRLHGPALGRGLLAFYLSCSGGALLSELIAAGVDLAGAPAVLAGVSGAVLASVWNYWSSARAAWGARPAKAAGASGPAVDLDRVEPAAEAPGEPIVRPAQA